MPILLTLAAILCWAAAPLAAQKWEINFSRVSSSFSKAPLGSLNEKNNKDDDTRLVGQYGYGVRITYNTRGYYGHEIGYIRTRAIFQTKIRPDAKTFNLAEERVWVQEGFYTFLMYCMPRGERWRPYIAAGLQAHQYAAPKNIPEFDTGPTRNYGVNFGVGLKLHPVRHSVIRLDFRHHIGGKPYDLKFEDPAKSGGILRSTELSAGGGITF
ncbi:MAG: outer membrane beta-barrel protein [Bryobacteraceae bacterium]